MQEDLKKIKKKYGENMMHLCRELFPTILEQEGLLYKILSARFAPTRALYDDIINAHMEEEFKSLIFESINIKTKETVTGKTPFELLKEAGYTLYECETEEDIQKFKKYYADGEQLCTFRGGRLNRCHVFFAVKDNVDEIKRENFEDPKRQDEYGTSVISIQFTKGLCNTLSIKNRYNHAVDNPDATFNNDLDKIIDGLTNSFSEHYGYNINYTKTGFELVDYILANDQRYYKYNYEFGNRYYCPGNLIIKDFELDTDYMNERYIVFDYFILDLKEKKITQYKDVGNISEEYDPFIDEFTSFDKAEVLNIEDDKRKITIKNKGKEDIIIVIDKFNRMVEYINNNMVEAETGLLALIKGIEKFEARNLKRLPSYALKYAVNLKELIIPNAEEIGHYSLEKNNSMKKLDLPNVLIIGDNFLENNHVLEKVSLPKVKEIGREFLRRNDELKEIDLPNVEIIDSAFLASNKELRKANLPNVRKINNYFLNYNFALRSLSLPNVEEIGYDFLPTNEELEELYAPMLKQVGDHFLTKNRCLKEFKHAEELFIGKDFLVNHPKFGTENIPILSSDDLSQYPGGKRKCKN